MAQVLQDFDYKYIDSATTTQVFTGPGTLHIIVVGTTAAGAISIIDGTAGTTANVGTLASNVAEGTFEFNCVIGTGLRIVTAAASKITVMYKKS